MDQTSIKDIVDFAKCPLEDNSLLNRVEPALMRTAS